EIAQAFEGVNRSNDLTDASVALRSALEGIRFVARDMAVNPSPALVKAFDQHHTEAVQSLEFIQKTGDPDDIRTIPHILRTIAGVKDNFAALAKGLEEVGHNDKQGINRKLREAAMAVERCIKDLGWLEQTDAQKLLLSLLGMKRFETEYKARRENSARKDFFVEFDNFNKAFDAVIGAEVMKAELRDVVKAYATTFREYVARMND